MGIYMYRVTKETVKLSNGEVANVAKFAYKPYSGFLRDAVKTNARAHFRSGCVADDSAAKNGKRSCWVVMNDTSVLRFPEAVGSFTDDDRTLRHLVTDVHVDLSHVGNGQAA